MTHPPFLLGCTILFWGWQSRLLPFAILMAVLLESARWIKWRWALSDKDFNRTTDLTSLSLVMAVLYLVNQQSVHGLMTLLNWLPMLLFLLVTAQIYSTHGSIKLSSLLLSLRHYEAKGSGISSSQRVDVSYPYMMICLLSASVGYHPWFFVGTCLLVTYGLWATRPQRYSILLFALFLMMGSVLGYVGHRTLFYLHIQVEKIMLDWFEEMLLANRDPYRQNTAIGDIGRLKQSERIILRVDAPYPILLREASYNIYFKTNWHAKQSSFTEIFPDNSDMSSWMFTPKSPLAHNFHNGELQPNHFQKIDISAFLLQGKGILALPHGTYQVSHLLVPSLQHNDFGAVKIENGPGLIEYTAHFVQNTPLDTLPIQKNDLYIPPKEKDHLIELSNNLGLYQKKPKEVLNTLATFFNQNFQYSLNLTALASNRQTPLENFLQNKRAGHCEYFATATTLLLRTVGIPSRYTVGYAALEFSELENVYVVRQRHAHAWTLAYINGRWQEFDTTPIDWNSFEEERAAWWKPIYDLWAWFSYKFSKWRWYNSESSNDWLLWLILPLSLILIWQLYLREKVARSQKKSAQRIKISAITGTDSAFFQIVQQLNKIGYIRQQGETLMSWLKRIQALEISEADMQTMLTIHQRYRFDPVGINTEEQSVLTMHVEVWLRLNRNSK
ncbi:transglutaminase-like domain-containing protein [Candidatus Parabeggiatoa sp. HSG14]|uniref:transglutaminase-like domain-containing protein n=1 Tax=Candidatus Parabeggiatoa sp. HSG14 TaxID=3055593 RepID=UPI0025A82278|nr:transglutaminase-like domain-containing protein [Thiotrichales bacterium HSG14]